MVIMTNELTYSWLRQEKEPESNYKWFTYYRDMDGIRQLKKVITDMKEKEPYLERYPTYNQLKKASSIWCWKQRTIDYDNYMQLQLIESHKQTLIIYEQESININQKLFKALNTEIDKLMKNTELHPAKKIKAFNEAQKLNKELLSGIEHIANIDVPMVKYIDVEQTRENNIIQSLMGHTNGFFEKEKLEDQLNGYTSKDVIDVINKKINKERSHFESIGIDPMNNETIKYNGKIYHIPKL